MEAGYWVKKSQEQHQHNHKHQHIELLILWRSFADTFHLHNIFLKVFVILVFFVGLRLIIIAFIFHFYLFAYSFSTKKAYSSLKNLSNFIFSWIFLLFEWFSFFSKHRTSIIIHSHPILAFGYNDKYDMNSKMK